MPQPLRAAVYARQSVAEPVGIAQQVEDLTAEVARRGWVLADTYEDDDTSGSRARGAKTAWHQMLRDFDQGTFQVLLVTEASRLTRSLTDVLEVRPPRRDMRVVALREGVDTVGDDDFLLKQMVLVAEREVFLKRQRAARYAITRRAAGHPPAGRTAYGYRWVLARDRDEAGTRLVVDEAEAEVVRRIYAEFLAGAPLAQIARDLTNDGLLTRGGTAWHSPSIRRVLMNPVYAALLVPSQPSGEFDLAAVDIEACTDGAWEAIVPREHLLATRGLLLARQPDHNGTARSHLLAGLVTCGVCGGPVRSARASTHPTTRKDGTRAPRRVYAAYRCKAGHFVRRADLLDAAVTELLIGRLAQEDTATILAARPGGPDLAVLNAQRTALQGRDEALAMMVATGKLAPAAAMKALEAVQAELAAVDAQIAKAAQADPLADVLAAADPWAWWRSATLARRRTVLELFLEVTVHPVGAGKRLETTDETRETITWTWRK